MNLSPGEVRMITIAAVEEVLARRPVPSMVTLTQAAEMLGVTRQTAAKMNLPRNSAGKIRYEDVLAARASR